MEARNYKRILNKICLFVQISPNPPILLVIIFTIMCEVKLHIITMR